MDVIKNKQGNTFIITIVLLLIFSILGLSLISLTLSGASKNEVRQDEVRASALAEKGMDRIIQEINSELTKSIGDGVDRNTFKSNLNQIIQLNKCETKENTTANKYDACITNTTPVIDVINGIQKENDIRKLLTIKSIGKSGEILKTIYTDIEIGAEVSPEVLNYAIGTNLNKKDGIDDGEGNLFLHGGVSITGDIKVDRDLITSKRYWLPDELPTISPAQGKEKSRIVLSGDSYRMNSFLDSWQDFFKGKKTYIKEDNINNLFSKSQAEIIKKDPSNNFINITDQKNNFIINSVGNYSTGRLNFPISNVTKDTLIPTIKKDSCYFEGILLKCREIEDPNGSFKLTGNNTFNKFSTIGDLHIYNSTTTFKKGLFVGGDLLIGRRILTPDVKVNLDGPIYVGNNVNIQGADLTTNLLIYAEGDVDIQFSKIEGKKFDDEKRGSLIIFAKGKIKLKFNSVIDNKPSEINGFFYSEKDIDISGIVSKLNIRGGISAKKIVLSGEESRDNSRLQIIYDQDIIETYSNLKQPEPIIYKVEPPIIKDREL
ncbi:hypothetical protein NSQ95_11645 [Psychrobacillus sp. FSL W7-1457]|uniref:hypothetical protein n=1 Tax=Psychrobacillus sp. FSL W7-1457 TaxID=2954547 RepID=UPI00315ADC13